MRDYQRSLDIDYSVLAHAQQHYSEAGYARKAAPWVVDEEAYRATAPDSVAEYKTIGGYLVGSAEHSFLQLLANGETLGVGFLWH